MASLVTSAFVGAVLGAVLGWGCQHTPLRPVVASVTSGILAWLLTTLVVAFLWLESSVHDAGIAAVSVDFVRLGVVLLAWAAVAAAIHLVLGYLGNVLPFVGANRGILVGAIGGLLAAALFTSTMPPGTL